MKFIIAFDSYNDVIEVWINGIGDRKKEYVSRIYADTPENREKINKEIEIRIHLEIKTDEEA